MWVDFHVHTNASPDSKISPKQLKNASLKYGIVPSITDHDTTKGWKAADDIGMTYLRGEEITSADGHIIGLYINETIKPGLSGMETIDKIKEQGGLSYIAHPLDFWRDGTVDIDLIKKADIIEVYNQKSPKCTNDIVESIADKHRLTKAAGSDSHVIWEFGKTYVELECTFDDIRDNSKALMKCLRKGIIHKGNQPLILAVIRGIKRALIK